MGGAVRLDVGAVDGGAFGDRAGRRKRLDQVSPEPFARPAVRAVVDRGRRAIVGRTIAPPGPDLENMDDAGDHTTIIDPASTALVPRQQRFNDRPLRAQKSSEIEAFTLGKKIDISLISACVRSSQLRKAHRMLQEHPNPRS